MFVSEISLWGAALVACIVIIASIALAIADWQMLKRMLTIFGATVAQMAIVVAVVCVVNLTHAWWSYLLWFVLVLVLSICWCLYPLQDKWRQMLWPVSMAMLAGSIVVGGSIILMLPISVFLSIYSVLMACMTASLMQTMIRHQTNQQKPEAVRDDMFHQVRNLAQPLVMVIPMLYAGMLLGGVPYLEGLLATLLLVAASFVANILAGIIALKTLQNSYRTRSRTSSILSHAPTRNSHLGIVLVPGWEFYSPKVGIFFIPAVTKNKSALIIISSVLMDNMPLLMNKVPLLQDHYHFLT